RSTNLSLVHTLDVRQQVILSTETATTFEAWGRAPTHMNAAHVSVAMLRLREAFATVRAGEALFFVVNGANVCVEAASLTEPFVTRWALVCVGFVRIVKAIDVVTQRVVLAESLQTMRTLRTIRSIENTRFAQRARHPTKAQLCSPNSI